MEIKGKDLTQSKVPIPGSIREMIIIALPMSVSFACDTVMIFTDRVFLSKLGPEFMSGAMVGGLSAFMMMAFFLGLTGYTTALVAHYFGAEKKLFCSVAVFQAIIIALIAYPIILLAKPLAYVLFDFMKLPQLQMIPQKQYFSILLFASIFGLLRNCLSGFFSGIGETRIIMKASISVMAINVGLSYILIFGKFGLPTLGVKGAAIGSFIAGFCGLLILARQYFCKDIAKEYEVFQSLKLNLIVMKKLLRFGYPAGLELFLSILAFNGLIMTFTSLGLVESVAASIVFNWDMVAFVPLLGMEIGVTSLVGRYMGAHQPDIAHRATMSGIKFGFMFSIVIFVLFLGFTRPLVEIFKPDMINSAFDQAVPVSIIMLRLTAIYVLIEAMFLALIGALRGAGDTFWAMCFSVTFHWIMTLTAYILLKHFQVSVVAGWISVIITFFLCFGVVCWRYAQGKWKTIEMI